MTDKEMFGNAKWIGKSGSPDAAIFRSEFEIQSADKAEITICGLGWFELYINGKRVSDDIFVPAYTDYHERKTLTLIYPLNDKWTHRINVLKYDISKYLHKGTNVIGVAVGGGYYHQLIRKAEGFMNYGDIKLCYSIDVDGKKFISDESVMCQNGFFKSSNLFFGEVHDYTDFDRKWNTLQAKKDGWENCICFDAPESEYYVQNCPTDKVIETLKPEFVKNFGDYSVYKIAKNISGVPVFRAKKKGERIYVECAEEIFDDCVINNRSIGYGEQRQEFEFVADSTEEVYYPHFSWFGFQYFSVTNNAEPVEVRVVHSDVEVTSDFQCSDETLNWLYKTYLNTQLCNMHSCVPSDCPHREKLGYTGDGQLCSGAVMTMLDAESFYRKWIMDIWDCQDANTGHVQHTAPLGGGGGGPAGWGGAIIVVPYLFFRHYGDKKFLEKLFPRMKLFVKYMESRCENGLIVREEKDGWCLGDWCTPKKVTIPEPFVNTTMYITQLRMMKFCAEVLNYNSSEFEKLISEHTTAVKEKYFDENKFSCLDGLQGADAFFADCIHAERKQIDNIVKKYNDLGEFDTGIFGTYILLHVLFENGYGSLATELLSNKNEVSFETMRRAGATTLWENWNGEASHSHPMFGASTQYLFDYILGIKQDKNSTRYDKVIISPCFADCLDFANGFLTTPHGKIGVDWKKENGNIKVEINLCNGVDAEFAVEGRKEKLCAGKNIIIL